MYCAANGSGGCSTFLHVVHAFLVKDGFEHAAELRARERFSEEIFFQGPALDLFAKLLKTILRIDEDLDDGAQSGFCFFKVF